MFAVGADWVCLEFFSIVCHFSFLYSALWEMTIYRLAARYSLSEYRQKLNIYDNVLILVTLFPRRLIWNKTLLSSLSMKSMCLMCMYVFQFS